MRTAIAIVVAFGLGASARAAEGIGFGASLRFGGDIPTSKLSPFVVGGLQIELLLPVMQRRLAVALGGTWTQPGLTGKGTEARVGGGYDFAVAQTEVKVGLDLIFRFFPDADAFVPYAGAGVVFQWLSTTETTSMAPGANTETSGTVGGEGILGADYKLGPGRVLLEARIVWSALNHTLTGNVNAGNVTVALGYRIAF